VLPEPSTCFTKPRRAFSSPRSQHRRPSCHPLCAVKGRLCSKAIAKALASALIIGCPHRDLRLRSSHLPHHPNNRDLICWQQREARPRPRTSPATYTARFAQEDAPHSCAPRTRRSSWLPPCHPFLQRTMLTLRKYSSHVASCHIGHGRPVHPSAQLQPGLEPPRVYP
jgi:hypothetical protein